MKNYYEELIKEIDLEIANKNFENALNLINEELNAPYIPVEFENYLNDKYIAILENTENNNFINERWNFDKILKSISQVEDQEIHLMAFDALRTMNIRKILQNLKEYLLNEKIKPSNKSFLLLILIEQSINQEIFVNKNGNTISINPSNFDLMNSQKILKNIELKLENLVYDTNPSLFKISKHIANNYFYYVFPNLNFKNYSLNDLCAAIIIKANEALGTTLEKEIEEKIIFNKENTMLLLNELTEVV
ncbi:DUF3196 family protein [Spiroplasma taiwanense]|uniref:Uncharacterized protein n=1 Tax=Spiroplasma taiwanense CT-1 TaxID=1276220 RepID=S5LTF0_9MOLU|nr:DUF3196 family protein [Spiroplasma taiwanense]AGR40984.1 hypothetical protein STAIW_v1c03260 [Spiroplasma taiwanense CT-1]